MRLGHEKARRRDLIHKKYHRYHRGKGRVNQGPTQKFQPGMYEGKTPEQARSVIGSAYIGPHSVSDIDLESVNTVKASATALGVHTSPPPAAKRDKMETPLKPATEPAGASGPTSRMEKTRNTAAPGRGLIASGPTASSSDFRTPSATTGPGSGCRR